MTDPWADPATETQPGAPYQGPPPTVPQYGYPPPYGYGYPATSPYPGYGYPGPWGPPLPRRPQRPGQLITSAVLAFVQAAAVLVASLYLWFFTSMIGFAAQDNPAIFASSRMEQLTHEATVLAVVQLLSAVFLVVAGVRALSAQSRAAWVLIASAHAFQVLLAIYWAIRLTSVVNDLPGTAVDGTPAVFTMFFAAAPAVGLGLVVVGPGRRWFESPRHP